MMLDKLSRAERDVYAQVILGLSNDEVAAHLSLCPETVKYHLTRMFKKIGCRSRTQLIVRHYRREIEKLKGTGKRFIYDE